MLLYLKLIPFLNMCAIVWASGVCEEKICIDKCCPAGYFYGTSKTCEQGHDELDFSDGDVYDIHISKTGESIKDTFDLLPGKFERDPNFAEFATDLTVLEVTLDLFTVYITEDGDLWTAMSNTYKKGWTHYKNGNFCAEYRMSIETGQIFLHFWGIQEQVRSENNDDYAPYAILVSCVFLLLVLIVYALLPELRNLGGLILMAYASSLFWAFLLLAVIQLGRFMTAGCITLTLSIYYSFLSSFCWMSVMSYDIWWTFRGYAKAKPIHRRGEKFKFAMYGLFAWGLPLPMTVILGVLNHTGIPQLPFIITPHIPRLGCFIDDDARLVYMYIPMLVLIVVNWVFYSMTAFNVWRLSRGSAVLANAAARGTSSTHRTQRHRFLVYLKLSIVMGLNWVFEVTSFLWPEFDGWYVTDAYNILVGLAIFLIFVCKPKIFRKLDKRLNLRNMKWHPSSKSYSNSISDLNQETVSMQVCSNPGAETPKRWH